MEVQRTAAMKSKILILHPGAHVGAGVEAGTAQIIRGLNEVLDASADTDCCIALETMAGKGSEIGRSFEELAAITTVSHTRNGCVSALTLVTPMMPVMISYTI